MIETDMQSDTVICYEAFGGSCNEAIPSNSDFL